MNKELVPTKIIRKSAISTYKGYSFKVSKLWSQQNNEALIDIIASSEQCSGEEMAKRIGKLATGVMSSAVQCYDRAKKIKELTERTKS